MVSQTVATTHRSAELAENPIFPHYVMTAAAANTIVEQIVLLSKIRCPILYSNTTKSITNNRTVYCIRNKAQGCGGTICIATAVDRFTGEKPTPRRSE